MNPVRVLLADDQPIVRAGLATILNAMPELEVIGEAPDGREAVRIAQRDTPDVCLFDINMPHMDGIDAAAALNPPGADGVPVVLITTFDSDDNIHRALRAGVRGFLLKGAAPEQISQALHAAASGNALFEPEVMVRIVQKFARADDTPPPCSPASPITDREHDVLRFVARGLSNNDVAEELHVSVSTVKFHVSSLMTKLDCRNRVELVAWAYQSGLV